MKGYEALAGAFAAEGTTDVFTMMGDANMHWLNALDALGVRLVDVRHEGAGLAMADGFARASGRPGVCSTTSGPGTAQLATTMVVAARARTPLVAFCGDVARGDDGNAQRLDQERFAAAVEAAFVRIEEPEQLAAGTASAFALARGESRPVMLSVPLDVQEAEVADGAAPARAPAEPAPPVAPDPARVAEAADLLAASVRPVLLVGRGSVRADAGVAVLGVGERIGAVIATTLLAKNWLNGAPFHAGISGGYGTRTARRLLADADCVVALGASLSPYTTDEGTLYANARLVHVDERAGVVPADGRAADCAVHADARLFLEALDAELEARGVRSTGYRTGPVRDALATAYEDPASFELDPGTVDPREACRLLDDALPGEIGLVLGSGQQIRFATMLLRRPRPFILAQHHFGCIGQGLTTAMGAVIARRQPAFVVEGDAGLMMHLAEFETAVRYDLPLLVVVMNDEALGAEYHKSRAIGLDGELARISTPDLGAVGVALGGRGALVRSLDTLVEAATAFAERPGPTLVDVRISRTVVSIPYRRTFQRLDV